MPKISVIIVSYNVQHFLKLCLKSVVAAAEKISTEIIVVDNNSSDASCSLIKKEFSQVKLIANKENTGFSRANNMGVEQAGGEFILILNPDTFIAEDTLINVVNFAEKQKNFGALGVKMIDGTGNFLPESKRNVPTLKVAMKKLTGKSKDYYASIGSDVNAEVEILTGAFLLLRREVYKNIGGFDEDYFMFGEDVDLCYKLLKEGYRNYYLGRETILHFKGESTEKDKKYLINFYGAMQIFYKKHFKKSWFSEQSSKLAVKTIIFLKDFNNSASFREKKKTEKILYFGNSKETFEKIQRRSGITGVEMVSILPADLSSNDLLIFDYTFISAKDIIRYFYDLRSVDISKRILPKRTSFYLGSDSSAGRGEVVKI